jgi:hypothetical protein
VSRDLLDERAFLVRSLADADNEHDAGDLSDEDYELLRGRDQRRLDEVERRLAAAQDGGGDAEAGTAQNGTTSAEATRTGRPTRTPTRATRPVDRTKRRRARILGLVGLVLFVTGGVLLVVHLTSQRLPGQTATGTVKLNTAQQINEELSQADTLLGKGKVRAATRLYTEVITQDPNVPQALAQLGWLAYQQGVAQRSTRYIDAGQQLMERAISVQPDFGLAHLYEGIMVLRQNNDSATAVKEFKLFLNEQPSAQNLANGAPFIRQAFDAQHLAVPAPVPAAPTASSSTTTTAPH